MFTNIDEKDLPNSIPSVARLITLNRTHFGGRGSYYYRIKTVWDGVVPPENLIYELCVRHDYTRKDGSSGVDWFIFGSDDSDTRIEQELSAYQGCVSAVELNRRLGK
jgi:hypothetical protein